MRVISVLLANYLPLVMNMRPATGRNKNIIRFSVNADMTAAEVDHVLSVCQEAFVHPDLEFV